LKALRVSLGEVLTRIKRPVEINGEDQYAEVGVYCFGRGLFHKPARSGLEVGDKALFVIQEGDFILQTTFAWEGAVAVAAQRDNGMFGSVRVLTFEPDRSKCNPKYLQLYLSTPHGREQLLRISPGSAGRNRVLNIKRLPEVTIPLPALPQQDQLVRQTQAIATRLAELRRLRQEIQDDAKALLHSVFHRLIQGAEYRPLAKVAPIVRRPVELDLDETYEEIGIRSFHKGVFFKCLSLGADISHKSMFQMVPGDLAFSNIMAWEGGIAVVRPEDQGRIGVHRFITCVPRAGVADAHFLWFYFQTGPGFEKIVAASPATIARNRTLSVKRLESIEVPVPTYEKQQEFSALQAKVAAIHQAQAANQAELDALLPAVLDKAFKGEL